MPEGDTIFKLAAYLRGELSGRRLVGGSINSLPGVDLAGAEVEEVYARGKHLFIELDRQRLLRSHLGMRGSWHGYAPGEPWRKPARQASIVVDTGQRVFVCFNALQVEMMRGSGVLKRKFDITLGPDLLSAPVDVTTCARRARELLGPQTPIVDVLLDQRVAGGIGNVYKSEVLFVQRCHPATQLGGLDDVVLTGLYNVASRLLAENVRGGPRVTRRANDQAGRLWVYGRTGRPCLRCDTPVRSARMGRDQRSTFWCPGCQPGL